MATTTITTTNPLTTMMPETPSYTLSPTTPAIGLDGFSLSFFFSFSSLSASVVSCPVPLLSPVMSLLLREETKRIKNQKSKMGIPLLFFSFYNLICFFLLYFFLLFNSLYGGIGWCTTASFLFPSLSFSQHSILTSPLSFYTK